MMKIKLFYNKEPFQNIVTRQEHGVDVWNDKPNSINDSSFYKILNTLGIEYEWSNNADESIVVADIGSLQHRTQQFEDTIQHVANRYKKAIIFSSQEPWQKDVIDRILEYYPNIFLCDTHMPLKNNKIYHERYIPFPSFIPSIVNVEQNIVVKWPDIDFKQNMYLFNCLMFNWRPDKHLLRSILRYLKLEQPQHLTTFRLPENVTQDHKNRVTSLLNDAPNQKIIDIALDGLETFPNQEAPSDTEVILQPYNRSFDETFRVWPKYFMDTSVLSVVCESFSGTLDQSGPYISEKSLYPLLNGHPMLAFAEQHFHSYLEEYGFELHHEIFDYTFDAKESPTKRAIYLLSQFKERDWGELETQINPFNSVTRQICRHNQYMLNNRSSKLWTKLKQNMENNLQRYLEL